MSKVMKTMVDGLRSGDKMYVELEEKKMEMEVQQRREERKFQLQLAQLLAGQPSNSQFQLPPFYTIPSPFYGSQCTSY